MTDFIQPDEFILLMDYPDGPRLSVDDMKTLRSVGVKTAVQYLRWRDVEVAPGEYRWAEPRCQIDRARAAGMKVLVSCYEHVPEFFPADWYMQGEGGRFDLDAFENRTISMWNKEAWNRHLAFMHRATQVLKASDVLLVRGVPHAGEVIFPDARFGLYGPVVEAARCQDLPPYGAAREAEWFIRESAIRKMLEEQRIFHFCGPELWTMLHHAFSDVLYTGNQFIDDIYAALHREFPDICHYGICYTFFVDSVPTGKYSLDDAKKWNIKLFVGSEYCEGLRPNTPKAIEMGLRGFITAPLHWRNGHTRLEPWMVKEVEWSLERWARA